MPTPRPETSVTRSAVLKPGSKMKANSASAAHRRGRRLGDVTPRDRGPANPLEVEPGAVVVDLDQDIGAFVECADGDPPALGLAGRDDAAPAARCRGRRRCAAGAAADRTSARAATCRARRARLRSLKSTGLPQLLAGGAHGALELRREGAERHHAEFHRLVLDVAGQAAQPGQVAIEVADGAGDAAADRRNVAGDLGELARQQMEFRIAIEFKIVEAVTARRSRGIASRPGPTIAMLPPSARTS